MYLLPFCTYASISLQWIPRCEIAGSNDRCIQSVKDCCPMCTPKRLASLYSQEYSKRMSVFPDACQHISLSYLLSIQCIKNSILFFLFPPKTSKTEHLFRCSFAIHVPSFVNCLFMFFAHFSILSFFWGHIKASPLLHTLQYFHPVSPLDLNLILLNRCKVLI